MPARNYLLLLPIFAIAFLAGRALRPSPAEGGAPAPGGVAAHSKPSPSEPSPSPGTPHRQAVRRAQPTPPLRRAPTAQERLVLSNPAGHAAVRQAVGAGLRELFPAIEICLRDDGQIGLVSLALRVDVTSDAASNEASVESVAFEHVAEGAPLSAEARDCVATALAQPVEPVADRLPLPDFDGAISQQIAFELGVPDEEPVEGEAL